MGWIWGTRRAYTESLSDGLQKDAGKIADFKTRTPKKRELPPMGTVMQDGLCKIDE